MGQHPNSRKFQEHTWENLGTHNWVESDWCRGFLFFATRYGFLRHLKTSLVFCPVRAPAFARHRRKSGASSTIGWSQNAWDISTHHIIQQNNTKDVGSFFKHHTRHQKTSKKTPFTLHTLQSHTVTTYSHHKRFCCKFAGDASAGSDLRCLPGAWRSAKPGTGTGSGERGGRVIWTCGVGDQKFYIVLPGIRKCGNNLQIEFVYVCFMS